MIPYVASVSVFIIIVITVVIIIFFFGEWIAVVPNFARPLSEERFLWSKNFTVMLATQASYTLSLSKLFFFHRLRIDRRPLTVQKYLDFLLSCLFFFSSVFKVLLLSWGHRVSFHCHANKNELGNRCIDKP